MTYLVLAPALLAAGDHPGALRAATHGVELAPGVSAAHAQLSMVRLGIEDWPGAEASAREALRLDPENQTAMNNLAVSLRRQGRRAEGVRVFDEAARLNPNNKTVRQNVRRVARTPSAGHLSKQSRALAADDARARRYRPREWDWAYPTRLRPWWWSMLKRMPAPRALVLHGAVFAALLAAALQPRASVGLAVLTVASGFALPFSVRRAWRWWRIRHPSARSWSPPDTD